MSVYSGNGSSNYVVIVPQIQNLNDGLEGGKNKDGGYDFSLFGIIGLQINVDGQGLSVSVTILGVPIGTFRGNLVDGLTISIDAWVVKGYLRFYLDDKDLWLNYNLKMLGAPVVDGNVELFHL
ncbi:hypothetical protein F8M41_013653 [Gigaspora margarita]|uniref:Uncharacterized protein n=1 Tax=Gigaspora margarita TaxID=4874 RepID=A0A8H4A0B6_GIGMA|nr:hypothetical protein F8M41_013653 [Gigaspora margarita]